MGARNTLGLPALSGWLLQKAPNGVQRTLGRLQGTGLLAIDQEIQFLGDPTLTLVDPALETPLMGHGQPLQKVPRQPLTLDSL